jgi:DNA-binding GntR family transcriptional regulator
VLIYFIAGAVILVTVAVTLWSLTLWLRRKFGQPVRPTLKAEVVQEIADLLRSGQKDAAIQVFREHTGAGLKDAREVIEGMERALSD